MKKLIYLTLSTVISTSIIIGCATSKNLDPTGVYHGDAYLYNIDKTVVTSYDSVDAFLNWELLNNSFLKTNSPTVFNLANELRDNTPKALSDINIARNYYLKYLGNTNELNAAVAEISSQAISALATVQTTSLSSQYSNILSAVSLTNTISSVLTNK